jgi:succinyl-diaminopimelate desuccinylase
MSDPSTGDRYRTDVPTSADHALDLTGDVTDLLRAIVDVPSVSGDERRLADLVHAALAQYAHLTVTRHGDAVVARTELGRSTRVAIAGHLDTVPEAGNLPSRLDADGDTLFGLGSCDMKGGVAVALHLAATVTAPAHDVTWVFYDCEEVEAERNGLRRLATTEPQLLAADFAVLMEPTDGAVEGGCQGTLRVEVRATGTRAHSARAWLGDNAIHALGPALDALRAYLPRRPVVDGLEYHEGLQAVRVDGGVAGNVVPDEAVLTVNHRFAPDLSEADALAHVRDVFAGYDVRLTDTAPAARPGLDHPTARAFVDSVGGTPRAKHGWTDVARFAELGVPAVNYGPGDPALAHTRDEHVSLAQVRECEQRMRAWLTG